LVLLSLMAGFDCTTPRSQTEDVAVICFALRLLVSFAHADVNQSAVNEKRVVPVFEVCWKASTPKASHALDAFFWHPRNRLLGLRKARPAIWHEKTPRLDEGW
jgi:hypothetical protein